MPRKVKPEDLGTGMASKAATAIKNRQQQLEELESEALSGKSEAAKVYKTEIQKQKSKKK